MRVEDFAAFGEVLRRWGWSGRLALMGFHDPWPSRGFDFRLNAPDNRYPEPEVEFCPECGQPIGSACG